MTELAYPLHAIREDGQVHHVATQDEARDMARNFGLHHVDPEVYYQNVPYMRFGATRHEWIVRDDWGRVVAPEDLPARHRRDPWWKNREDRARHAAALGIAIPGTGRRCYGRYRRSISQRPTAMAQTDALAADMAEIGYAGVRTCRHIDHVDARELPPRNEERCWKTQRRTQWK